MLFADDIIFISKTEKLNARLELWRTLKSNGLKISIAKKVTWNVTSMG